jgi:hypothetical protein
MEDVDGRNKSGHDDLKCALIFGQSQELTRVIVLDNRG